MSYDCNIINDFMRSKFTIFFLLIAFATVLSIVDNWIIQDQFRGGVTLVRAAFQITLVVLILYTLWRRAMAAYVLALGYTISVSVLHGYELSLYFLVGDVSPKLPTSFVIISLLLIVSTFLAVGLFGLDYLDHLNRRKS